MPLSLALPLRLLDALTHLVFVMQTGISTSLASGLLLALVRLVFFFAAAGSVELCNRRRFQQQAAAASAAAAAAVQAGGVVQDAGTSKVPGNKAGSNVRARSPTSAGY